MKTELRHIQRPLGIETRDDGIRTLSGYGAVFYREDEPGSEFRLAENYVERIASTAFDRAIKEDDPRGLFNHEADNILGRVSSGTMRLTVDGVGLKYEIDLPDSDIGNRVATAIERGDITGSSFAFRARGVEMSNEGEGVTVRTLTDVSVSDTGPVTYPAYEGTSADVRSVDAALAIEQRDAWALSVRERDAITVRTDMVSRGLE